jgi:hypothetical protein
MYNETTGGTVLPYIMASGGQTYSWQATVAIGNFSKTEFIICTGFVPTTTIMQVISVNAQIISGGMTM